MALDLYCGLGGWAEGFLSEGYEVLGIDIERHDYGHGSYPGVLALEDVLSINGAKFKNFNVIVASPPCQEPSYRAMPWSRAKALNAIGPPHKFIALFNACFRIQREASEAKGHYIPMIVENVKGAQPWVGRAQANYGSYFLWGDVGRVGNRVVVLNGRIGKDVGIRPMKASKNGGGSWFAVAHNTVSGKSQNPDGRKISGQNWSKFKETGEVYPHWSMEGLKRVPHKPTGHWTNPAENGIKQKGSGREWFAGEDKISRMTSSHSKARARASAEIAKIPFPLAQHIARCFKP